ncbi:MAG: glycosyltransferase family 4 protein, partial [Casimicrobiaceae bacterium]
LGGPGLLHFGRGLKIYEAHEHWLVCPTHVLWRFGREPCDERHCLRCLVSYRRPPQPWRYTGALERGLDHVDAIVAKSEFSRDMHRRFGFERAMTVVPYFLPDVATPQQGPSPSDRPYFLFVGRLERIKGVQDILPAFAGATGPDLLIVGSGAYEAQLRELAADKPRVRFVGRLPVDETTRYYRHAQALIVPSLCYETFGIILIEAFRCGTPVIAHRIGPFPEIVAAGGGVLYEGDRELAAAVDEMAANPDHRHRLGRAARAAFETTWCEDVVLRAYLDLLHAAAIRKGNHRVVEALERLS